MGNAFMQCLSTVDVTADYTKRCIRQVGHFESHIWIEAETRSDRLPMLVRWDGYPVEVQRFEYTPIRLNVSNNK